MNPFAGLIAQVTEPPPPDDPPEKRGRPRKEIAMASVREKLEPILRTRDLTAKEAYGLLGASYAATYEGLSRAVRQGLVWQPRRGIYRHKDRA